MRTFYVCYQTMGQTTRKPFDTREAAMAEVERLLGLHLDWHPWIGDEDGEPIAPWRQG